MLRHAPKSPVTELIINCRKINDDAFNYATNIQTIYLNARKLSYNNIKPCKNLTTLYITERLLMMEYFEYYIRDGNIKSQFPKFEKIYVLNNCSHVIESLHHSKFSDEFIYPWYSTIIMSVTPNYCGIIQPTRIDENINKVYNSVVGINKFTSIIGPKPCFIFIASRKS